MSAGSVERRQRIREQIREFYGDPTANRERRPPEGARSGVPPEMDLDSEYFNVGKYTTDLLRRESLKGLVETDTELLRNVRHLDGELQELVYRNYAKFISATDTIREMRDNITEMEAKLKALSSNVENIDQVSKNISDKLQTHRSRIEEMISSNRMLRKVQFLVDLADTMRRLIERREYTACVKYWLVGDGFLAKHADLPSIAKIRDECRLLAQQLYDTLRETIYGTSLEDPEAMDVIRCIVEDMRLIRTTSLFPESDVPARTGSSGNGEAMLSSFENEILDTLMKNLSANFAAGIQSVNNAVKAALAVPNFDAMERSMWPDTLRNANIQEALAQLKSTCALFSSNSERVYSLFHPDSDATVTLRIVQEVQPVLIDMIAPITSHLSELLIATVDAVAGDGVTAMRSPADVRGSLDAIFTSLARLLRYYAGTFKTLGANYLDNAHSQQSRPYAALVSQSVAGTLHRLLSSLERRATEAPPQRVDPTHLNNAGDADEDDEALRFCVTRLFFAAAAAAADEHCAKELSGADAMRAGDAAEVRRRCAAAARLLARRGAVLTGQLQTAQSAAGCCGPQVPQGGIGQQGIGQQGMGQQGMGQPPAGPSAAAQRVVRQWVRLYEVLRGGGFGAAAGGGGERSSGHGTRQSQQTLAVGFTRQEGDVIQNSVDRMFPKQTQSPAMQTFPRDVCASAVVGAIALYFLKGLVEFVRRQAYTRSGFQHVQINCTFLLHALTSGSGQVAAPMEEWLRDWSDDGATRTAHHLLNECCTCAYERCNERVPLAAAVVDKIVKMAVTAKPSSVAVIAPTAAPEA